MTERPTDLPDFNSPPLEEVAMSVQFEPIPAFGARMQAQVWARFSEKFPEWVEQQVLPPTFELFGIPDRPHHLIQLAAQLCPPTSRALFVDEKKTELLQLQSDRFVRNWRRFPGDAKYPRFEPLLERFCGDYGELQDVLRAKLRPNQCELTYVNLIPLEPMGKRLADVVRFVRNAPGDFLPVPEREQASTHYVVSGDSGPLGRLHVQAEQYTQGEKSSVRLSLTARGAPLGSRDEGVTRFFELGREWIVRGFTEVTTGEMHEKWGRIQ